MKTCNPILVRLYATTSLLYGSYNLFDYVVSSHKGFLASYLVIGYTLFILGSLTLFSGKRWGFKSFIVVGGAAVCYYLFTSFVFIVMFLEAIAQTDTRPELGSMLLLLYNIFLITYWVSMIIYVWNEK